MPKFNSYLTQTTLQLKRIRMQKELGTELCRARWQITEPVQSLMKIKHQSLQWSKAFHLFDFSSFLVSCPFDMWSYNYSVLPKVIRKKMSTSRFVCTLPYSYIYWCIIQKEYVILAFCILNWYFMRSSLHESSKEKVAYHVSRTVLQFLAAYQSFPCRGCERRQLSCACPLLLWYKTCPTINKRTS